ncbi:hypothetical protein [Gymnodinialimonas ulvae]|uniref:hypothetical protein n=1 Tax=Gymnodinialimonas ulvae TaxID=3126504 RepID=UPI003099C66C
MPDLNEIECDLVRERDALRTHMSALGGDLRPARLIDGAMAQMTGGDLAAAVGPALRSPKVPLALAGLGISWFAAQMATTKASPRIHPASSSPSYDPSDTGSVQGFRRPTMDGPEMAEFDARLRAADAASTGRFGTETYEGDTDMTTSNHTENPSLRDRAYASAEVLRGKIEDGMGNLPNGAKARIRAAREAAINAQAQAEHHASRAATATKQTAQENPLLIGALVFAAGAALAAALPRTSVENRSIGAHRDRLFDEADRVFREEVENAKVLARDTVAKGQEQVKDTIGSVADTVSEKAQDMKSGNGRPKVAAHG